MKINIDNHNIFSEILENINKKDYEKALLLIKKIINIDNNNINALLLLATLYKKKKNIQEALKLYEFLLKKFPRNSNVIGNYANLLSSLNKFDCEYVSRLYINAIKLDKNNQVIIYNYSIFLLKNYKVNESLFYLKKLINIDKNNINYLIDYGICYFNLNQNEEALFAFNNALKINNNSQIALFNLSLVLLRLKKFDIAAKYYRLRFILNKKLNILFQYFNKIPEFKNNNISDKKILVWNEQGFGDAIHFSQYIKKFDLNRNKYYFLVPKELNSILSINFENINIISSIQDINDYDYHIPLLSLLELIKNINNIFLYTEKFIYNFSFNTNLSLEKFISQKKAFNIGLVCSGNVNHDNDYCRSIKLEKFKFLSKYGNIFLIQKEIRNDDLIFLKNSNIINLSNKIQSFDDTANLLNQIDFLVTVDTSVVHLAGAMGINSYLLLPLNSDWRWGENNNESIYKSVIIIKQIELGNWDEPLKNLENNIKKLLS